MTAPAVTVLMPVHNGASFLREALDSILQQTFADFELLVINDGSTDETSSLLQRCGDERLAVVENESNLGVIASLNRGLALARGEYVARMDADDIALPSRLEKQFQLLRLSPRTGLCGTWFRIFGDGRSTIVHPPVRADDMAARLFYESPLGHPTVMFRRALFEKHGLRYSPEYPHAEDYELWTRVAEITELANVPQVLLHYRSHGAQVTSVEKPMQQETVRKILLRQLHKLHPAASTAEGEAHVAIVTNRIPGAAGVDAAYVDSWLGQLVRMNERGAPVFPAQAFRRALALVWWRYCSTRLRSPGMLGAFYGSALTRALPWKNKLGILALRTRAMTTRS
jgi:hypothetical protein